MAEAEISNSNGFVNTPENLNYLVSKVESFEGNNLLHQTVLDDSVSDNSEGWRRLYGILQCFSSDSVNDLNDNGYSALHLAVLKERLWMVKMLLYSSRNIDFNSKSSFKKLSNTALHSAAKLGNVLLINELLKKGVDVNARNTYNQTPLHFAVQSGSLAIVKLLVKMGAIENSEDYVRATPLHYAVKFGEEDIFKWLINRNAYLNNSRDYFNTFIHDAAFSGNSVIVEILVNKGVDVNAAFDNQSSSPLHLAVQSGDSKTIKCLVTNGANVNAVNRNRETVLNLAARFCDLDTFSFLEFLSDHASRNDRFLLHQSARSGSLEKIASLVNENTKMNIRDRFGLSPLHHAILSNNYDTVKFLVYANAFVNVIATDEDYKSALQFAVESGNSKVIELLLSRGAIINKQDCSWLCRAVRSGNLEIVELILEHCPDVNVYDEDDKTPIYYASFGNHVDIIQTLLDRGAHVNAAETTHNPLHVAALLNRTEAAKALLERGAVVDAKDANDHTPLIHALAFGDLLHSGIVTLLINWGADIRATSPDGNTALHYACQMHTFQLGILNLLFQNGADVDATNARGRTPLHCTAIANNVGALRLLVEKKADLNPKDVDGDTPLHYASRRGHERFVTVLLKKGAQVNVKGQHGRTPLHLAEIEGGDEVFDALLKMGANVNAVDDDGKTPSQYEENGESSSSDYSSESY